MDFLVVCKVSIKGLCRLVGCLADSLSVIYRGHEFEPQPGHIAFDESDHEIISIFSLPLIQRRAVVGHWRKYMYVLSVLVTTKE